MRDSRLAPPNQPRSLLGLLLVFAVCVGLSRGVEAEFSRTWELLETTGEAPGIIAEHTAILDPVANRMVVFGGFILEALDSTFALDLDTLEWSLLDTGAGPSARFNHVAFYDAAAHRMVVYGGTAGNLGVLSDVWALDLATDRWALLAPPNSFPRTRSAVALDSGGRRAFLVGGTDGNEFVSTTLVLDLVNGAVTELATTGDPMARFGATLAWDGARDRLLLFGGNNFIDYFNDTWQLSLSSGEWQQIFPPVLPSQRAFLSGFVDEALERWIVFGGNFISSVFDETWVFDLVTDEWELLTVQRRPTRRNNTGLIFDPVSRRAFLFGGNFVGALLSDVWRFEDPSLDTGSGLLRFNGEAGAVDATFVTGTALRLEIQSPVGEARHLLFAEVRGESRPTFLTSGLPFCFDPVPGSPTFSANTVLVCDAGGLADPPSPFSSLRPARLPSCPFATSAPGFSILIDETEVDLRPGLTFLLQALVQDGRRPLGFGSTPCVRVTVVP